MEHQQQQPSKLDLGSIHFEKSDTLFHAPSILFIGFCSTGGGHTEREFNVVRSVIKRSYNNGKDKSITPDQEAKAQRCLKHGSVVIFVLPPAWKYQPENYYPSSHKFLQELKDPALGLHVIAVQGSKTAASVYAENGGRPALLRLHARFPFDTTQPQILDFEGQLKSQQEYYEKTLVAPIKNPADARERFGPFRNGCLKMTMMDLVPQVLRASGENPNKIWGSTDMDFALTRALHKWQIPSGQIVDHESILNLFVENPFACRSFLEYCYMGKVLPSNVVFSGDGPVRDPETNKLYFMSKTAHISLSTPNAEALEQPNTLIQLREMVRVLEDAAPGTYTSDRTGAKGGRDGGEVLRELAWKALGQAGVQLTADQLAKADKATGGFVYGKDPIKTPLGKVDVGDIKGFVYLYLMDATGPIVAHIAEQLKKDNPTYQNIVFLLCAGGGFREKDLPMELKNNPQKLNAMMYGNLMGGDAVMQAGMGTSSEWAYSVVNGCRDIRLLVWPMKGQDEHASNARFVNSLFPDKVTQINELNYAKALDDLMAYRHSTNKETGQSNGLKAYGADYVRGILNPVSIADVAADVLLEDKELAPEVENALINVSEPRLKVAYRLMKICVQMLDQLEGPDKKVDPKVVKELGDGIYPYDIALNDGKGGKKGSFVIALRRGKQEIFPNSSVAAAFFKNITALSTFLEVDAKMLAQVYEETKVAERVIEALQPEAKDLGEAHANLVKVCARYALKDISDVVKTGV